MDILDESSEESTVSEFDDELSQHDTPDAVEDDQRYTAKYFSYK